jgi:hypothetical protein
MTASDPQIEAELLAAATSSVDRIGTGLALALFRRMRLNRAERNGQTLQGSRTASVVRERNDSLLKVI